MPYRDKEKQLKYNKQWKAKNKEKVKEYQSFHQKTYRDKKYQPMIEALKRLSYKLKKEYLLKLPGAKRQAILRKMNDIELKRDIQKTIKQERQKKANLRANEQWEYIKKWMTDRGCDCGEKNITKLSFHHLDPNKKESTIRKMCGHSMKKILAELQKGAVKCKNCHTIIHAGTSQQREEILINQYFNKKPNKKWGYKNKLMIWEYKKSLSCIKCEIDDPVILLFHHIDSKLKSEKISTIFKKGRDAINQEISKTICLCHNCHEDFHYTYGRKDNAQAQLEQYIGKKVIPLKVNIQDYLPIVEQNISQFYDLPFLIA